MRVDVIRFFLREIKADILKLGEFRTSEVGTKLDMPHKRIWRSFLVNRKFVDPFRMYNAKKKNVCKQMEKPKYHLYIEKNESPHSLSNM